MHDVRETRLPNGLMILTRELHHAPVASFWRAIDLEPLPWVSGDSDAPVSTLGGRVCKPHARFCPHNPPCKGV